MERIGRAKDGFIGLVTLLRLLNIEQNTEVLETIMDGRQVGRKNTSNPGQNLSYIEEVMGQKARVRVVVKPEQGAKRFNVRYQDGQANFGVVTPREDPKTGEIISELRDAASSERGWIRTSAATVEALIHRTADVYLIPAEEVPISHTEFLHKPGFTKEQFARNEAANYVLSEFYQSGIVPQTAPRDHRFVAADGSERGNLGLCSAQRFIQVKNKEMPPRPLKADELMHLERFGPQAPDRPIVVLDDKGKPKPIMEDGKYVRDDEHGEYVMVRGKRVQDENRKDMRVKVERRPLSAEERQFYVTLCQSYSRAECHKFLNPDADNNEGNFLIDPATGQGYLTDNSYGGGLSEPYESFQVDRFGNTVKDENGQPKTVRDVHMIGVTMSFIADTAMPHPDWLADQEAYKRYSEVLDKTEKYSKEYFPRIRKIRQNMKDQRELLGVSSNPEKMEKEIADIKIEMGKESTELKFLHETFLYQYEHPAIAEFQLEQHLRRLKYLVYRGSPPRIPEGQEITMLAGLGLNPRTDQWVTEDLTSTDLADTMQRIGV